MSNGNDRITHSLRLFQLLLLAIAICAVNYVRFALGPLQEAMRLDLGFSDNQMALIQGPAIGVPLALGAIPLGYLFDRYSRARLFFFFLALSLAAMVLIALTSEFTVLFIARAATGCAMAAIFVAAYSIVGDLYPPEQRGRATMVVTMGEIAAGPAAFALGGMLLALSAAASVDSGLAGWRWALLWMCAPLVPLVLVMLALRKRPGARDAVKNPSFRALWPQLWHYRRVAMPLLLTRILIWVADGAVLVWGAPTFARRFALPPDRIGAIMAAALLIAGIVGPLLGGTLADLCQRTGGPRRTVTALCLLALLAVPAGLFGIMTEVALASIAITAFLMLGFTINVVAFAVASIVLPGELRGLYFGMTFTVAALVGLGVAPLIVSALSAALGGPATVGTALAIVCAVTSVLGAAFFGFTRRNFPGVQPPSHWHAA